MKEIVLTGRAACGQCGLGLVPVPRRVHNAGMLDETVQHEFSAGPGYLNTASAGLPPKKAVAALRASLADWEEGRCDPASFDEDVERARRAYGRIVGADLESVGIVSQVSVVSGLVASSLAEGATVLCAEEDFTSVLFPFLADTRLDVQLVPLQQLIDRIEPTTDLVAVSAVQSAAGWLPLNTDRFDVTSCGAYKWLCSPRGSGFVTVGPQAGWLEPRYAGWYSGDEPWQSIYGPPLRLADDARRFNVSPAWFDFVAAARAVEFIAELGVDAINAHSIELANSFCDQLGLAPANGAIVSVDSPHGGRLTAAGIAAAARAGKVRLSFYLYNTVTDTERAADLLRTR